MWQRMRTSRASIRALSATLSDSGNPALVPPVIRPMSCKVSAEPNRSNRRTASTWRQEPGPGTGKGEAGSGKLEAGSWNLLVSKRFIRAESRRFDRREEAEEEADAGGEADADRS